MHVISEKKLREFWQQWPDAETPLRSWHRVAERARWETFADVKEVYGHADRVGRCTVFNVGRNKFRLVAAIHFNRGKIYIRHVMTHEQYDRGSWKEDCECP
jgi:mRNA interferase HigB